MSLDQRNTEELKSELARGELSPRKKAFVREILRRRKEGAGIQEYAWLGTILAAFGFLGAAVTGWRLWASRKASPNQ